MELLIPGLYASTPKPLPFAPSLAMRAFLLRREAGNLLVYGANLEGEEEAIETLGGVSRHYLGHHHEAEFVSGEVQVGEASSPDNSVVGGDFEAVPIPGHTPGATAYVWEGPGGRALFTGDTIYLSEGEWVAAVLESSDRASYTASLERIRELEFDLLVPWIATSDGPFAAQTDPDDARRRVDAIIERIKRGESR